MSPNRTSIYSPSAITTLTTSNRFARIFSTVPLMEGSILDDCSSQVPVQRFLNVLNSTPLPQVILNVVADIGLLLLVPWWRSHRLRLPPGPEPSLVPLLLFVPLPL